MTSHGDRVRGHRGAARTPEDRGTQRTKERPARFALRNACLSSDSARCWYTGDKCNREGPVVAVRGKSSVDDSVDVIADALLTASRLLVAISARSIAEVDESITTPQFRALVILSSRGPSNLATLAALLDVQPSTIGRMVERLVSAGLIDRRQHPNSRRELMVELSPRGHDVVDTVTARRREEIARVVHAMPERERRGLVTALTAFTAAGGEPPAHSSM